MRRALTVVAATMFTMGGLAGTSATAATLPLCEEGDGYVPGETCDAAVTVDLDCPGDVPTVEYAVNSGAAEDSTVDIVWTDLPGEDVVLADQPLSGSLAWPAGVTSEVTIVFGTTPVTAVLAEYPCAEEGVAPGDEDEGGTTSRSTTRTAVASRAESGVLAETGATGLPIALGGGALVVGGAAAVLLARRGRQAGATE